MAREPRFEPKPGDLQDVVVKINRCAKVMRGGRRFSFSALVVIGDQQGRVGIGFGKANEVPASVEKANKDARKNVQDVTLIGGTIPHPIEGRCGAVAMLVPHATLEPVRDKLTQLFFGEGLTHDPEWIDHIGRELNHAKVRLQAVLAEARLPVDQILQWKPGSHVPLNIGRDAPATITCDEVPMFRGDIGQRNGISAIEITDKIDPEETLCDVLSAR